MKTQRPIRNARLQGGACGPAPRRRAADAGFAMRQAVICALVLSAAMPATAQQRKTVAGTVSIIAGVGLVIEAYDSVATCTERYQPTTPRDQLGWGEGGVHQCVRVHSNPDGSASFDIVDATYETGIRRPGLAWAGLGAISLGVVALLLPDHRATRDLDVQVSPERVAVRRKFGW